MVVISLGINKGQKKFAPKVRPQQERRPQPIETINEQPPTTTLEEINQVSPKTAPQIEETSESIPTGEAKPFSQITSSKVIDESKDSSVSPLLPKKVTFAVQELTPPSSQVIEPVNKPKASISKPKSKGVAILTPSASISRSETPNNEVDKEYSDPTQLVDVLELVQKRKAAKAINKQSKEKKPRAPRAKKVDSVESSSGSEKPASISDFLNKTDDSDIPTIISAPEKDKPKRVRKKTVKSSETASDLKNVLDTETSSKPKRRRKSTPSENTGIDLPASELASQAVSEPVSEKVVIQIPKAPKRPPKGPPRKKTVISSNRAIVQAMNEYKGASRLNLEALPISVLCSSNIDYGEEIPKEQKINYSKPSRESAPQTKAPRPRPSRPSGSSNVAVQVKIVNGVLQVDEESQQIALEEFETFQDTGPYEVIEEGSSGRYINCMTYVKRTQGIKWSLAETDLFYQGLVKWGSDFEMISKEFFPHRDRKQIRYKFKREEAKNPVKIKDALLYRKYVPA